MYATNMDMSKRSESFEPGSSTKVSIKFKVPTKKPFEMSLGMTTSAIYQKPTARSGTKLVQYDSDSDDENTNADNSQSKPISEGIRSGSERSSKMECASSSKDKRHESTRAVVDDKSKLKSNSGCKKEKDADSRRSKISPSREDSTRKKEEIKKHKSHHESKKSSDRSGHEKRDGCDKSRESKNHSSSSSRGQEREKRSHDRTSRKEDSSRSSHHHKKHYQDSDHKKQGDSYNKSEKSSHKGSESCRRSRVEESKVMSGKTEVCILDEMSPERRLSEQEVRKKHEVEKIIFYNLEESAGHSSYSSLSRSAKRSSEEDVKCKEKSEKDKERDYDKKCQDVASHKNSKKEKERDHKSSTKYDDNRDSNHQKNKDDDDGNRHGRRKNDSSLLRSSSERHKKRSRSRSRRRHESPSQASAPRGSRKRERSHGSRSRSRRRESKNGKKHRSRSLSSSAERDLNVEKHSGSSRKHREHSPDSHNSDALKPDAPNLTSANSSSLDSCRSVAKDRPVAVGCYKEGMFSEPLEDIPLPDSKPAVCSRSQSGPDVGERIQTICLRKGDVQVIELDGSDIKSDSKGYEISKRSETKSSVMGHNSNNCSGNSVGNQKIVFSMKDSKRSKLIHHAKQDIFREDSDEEQQNGASNCCHKLIRTPVKKESNLVGLKEILSPVKSSAIAETQGRSIPVITSNPQRLSFAESPSRLENTSSKFTPAADASYLPMMTPNAFPLHFNIAPSYNNLLYPTYLNPIGVSRTKTRSEGREPRRVGSHLPSSPDLDIFSPDEPSKIATIVTCSPFKPSQLTTERRIPSFSSNVQKMKPRRVFEEFPRKAAVGQSLVEVSRESSESDESSAVRQHHSADVDAADVSCGRDALESDDGRDIKGGVGEGDCKEAIPFHSGASEGDRVRENSDSALPVVNSCRETNARVESQSAPPPVKDDLEVESVEEREPSKLNGGEDEDCCEDDETKEVAARADDVFDCKTVDGFRQGLPVGESGRESGSRDEMRDSVDTKRIEPTSDTNEAPPESSLPVNSGASDKTSHNRAYPSPAAFKNICLWRALLGEVMNSEDAKHDASDKNTAQVDVQKIERRRSSRLRSREDKKTTHVADVADNHPPNEQTTNPCCVGEKKFCRGKLGSDAVDSSPLAPPPGENTPTRPAEAVSVRLFSPKPEKVKSRWWRNSELETDKVLGVSRSEGAVADDESDSFPSSAVEDACSTAAESEKLVDSMAGGEFTDVPPTATEQSTPDDGGDCGPTPFLEITENIYLSERDLKKQKKESRRMVCDCVAPSAEDVRSSPACGEDCLNRMLMIECGSRCPCVEMCTNRQFSEKQYAATKCFKTQWKGWGLQADQDIPVGAFIMEYVGEVLDYKEFKARTRRYDREKIVHHYFMALNGEEVIDATRKGNISRFINHCCDPNAETQKWTVNGQLRVGFFAVKPIRKGEEITFNYQFESYGSEQIKCYCSAATCRGTIGNNKSTPLKSRRSRSSKNLKKKKSELFSDLLLDSEIDEMACRGGLLRKSHVLELNRLMLRADTFEHRLSLLKVLQDTKETACLRLFIEYHGLSLLWSWMVDISPEADAADFKIQVINTLRNLPINNKTVLKNSRILVVVEKWAQKSGDGACPEESLIDVRSPDDPRCVALNKTLALLKEQGNVLDAVKEGRKEDDKNSDEVLKMDQGGEDQKVKDESMEVEVTGLESVVSTGLGLERASVLLEVLGDGDKMETSEVDVCVDEDGERVKDNDADSASRFGRAGEVEFAARNKVGELAEKLLESWMDLKEVFKIPKIKVEERKKTELELDLRCEDDEHKRTYKGWDKIGLKRPADDVDAVKSGIKRKKIVEDDFKQNKLLKNRPIIQSQSSENLTKLEHRQQFEAQFKAKEQQKAELAKQQQLLQQQKLFQKQSTPSDATTEQVSFPIMTILKSQDSSSSSSSFQDLQQQQQQQQQHYYMAALLSDATSSTAPSLAFVPNAEQPPGRTPNTAVVISNLLYGRDLQTSNPTSSLPMKDQAGISANAVAVLSSYQHPTLSGMTYMPDVTGATTYTFPEASTNVQDLSLFQFVDQSGNIILANPHHSQVLQAQQPLIYPAQSSSVIIQQQHPYAPSIFPTPSSSSSPSSLVSLGLYSQGSALVTQDPPPPPPSPPKQKRLPPNWKSTKDSSGKVYYYHTVTRQTQWEPPLWDCSSGAGDATEGADDPDDCGATSLDNHQERTTTTAPADTSSSEEVAKKIKDHFRSKIAKHIVNCLEPYKKADCKQARITSTTDFKYLARKVTHAVMIKELRQCRHVEDLEVNDNVKFKARDYVGSYMGKFGPVYSRTAHSPRDV